MTRNRFLDSEPVEQATARNEFRASVCANLLQQLRDTMPLRWDDSAFNLAAFEAEFMERFANNASFRLAVILIVLGWMREE